MTSLLVMVILFETKMTGTTSRLIFNIECMGSAMALMTLHLVNARKQLSGMDSWLSEKLNDAFAVADRLLPLEDTDVVVRAGTGIIPEKGHLGYAPAKGVVYVTVNPGSPSLQANEAHSLERMLAHELHHSARWDGPGYGETLGEALVSEGLAGHFAQEAFAGDPEPWERLPASDLRPYLSRAEAEWGDASYDHAAWFFGSQDLPRWLGYSLGYQLVRQYLSGHGDERASSLVHASADDFRACISAV